MSHWQYLLIIFLSLPILCFSQQKFVNYTINEGLSQNYIFSIMQDRKGFVWIGTKDGLNRFDGYEFKCYRHSPLDSVSLSGNVVSAIFEDSKGRMWIGTNGEGLNLFEGETETFRHFRAGKENTKLSSDFISVIYETRDGFIWAGTNDGGLNRIELKSGNVKKFICKQNNKNGISSNFISGLSETKNGLLWIATTNGGLNCYNPKLDNFTQIYFEDKNGIDLRFVNDATSVHADKNGLIWFGSASGLNLYNPNKKTVERFPVHDSKGSPCLINNIFEKDNQLFISSFTLFGVFNKITHKYKILFEHDEIWFTNAACTDKSGIFWLGTGGWGIIKFNPNIKPFNKKAGNFLKEIYPAIFGNLRKYLGNKAEELTEGRGTDFLPVIKTSDGGFFAAITKRGVFRFDRNGNITAYFSTNPVGFPAKPMLALSHIFEDRSGTIWTATIGGVNKFDASKGIFIHYRLYADKKISTEYLNKSGAAGYSDISAVYIDHNNIFWLGTPDRGLFRFDTKKNQTKLFQQNNADWNSLNNNQILSIAEDENSGGRYLWIGTEGGGLNHFEKATGKSSQITIDDGLPNNTVYGILTDKFGNLWLSTNKGICCFNPVAKSFRNYDVKSGLQSNEFNRKEYFKAEDGKLFFGGISGYNSFYPENIKRNLNKPSIVFTRFKIFNKEVNVKDDSLVLQKSIEKTKRLLLEYSQNVITIEFAALEYTIPEHNLYKYKLEGFHNDWINAGTTREATFTNLDPGEYKLRVCGANNDEIWGGESLLEIRILPPFYMTWWFKILGTLSALTLIILFVIFLIMRKANEKILKSKQETEIERERVRIARDLHDEVGSRLTELKMISEAVIKKELDEFEMRTKMEELSAASENVITTFSEIVWSLNPQNDSLEDIVEFIGQNATDFLAKANIRCRLDFPDILPDYKISSDLRQTVIFTIKELMNNIVKHSSANVVNIILILDENKLTFIIKDDGFGFNLDNTRKFGNGLANIKSRIEAISGKLVLESKIEKGTTTKISIPIKKM